MVYKIWRISHWLSKRRVPFIPKILYVVNRIVFSAAIPPEANIGRNVVLGYQGLGIVIHRQAVLGDNVSVGSGVTIGGRSEFEDVPVIENDVLIGTGAKIIGPVHIGHHARIGANAVVLHDVPAYGVAVGVPARVVKVSVPQ